MFRYLDVLKDNYVIVYSLNRIASMFWASQVVLVPPTNAGHIRDVSLISGSERSPGGGDGNPLQYSCLANPMDRA